jgi:hypothetical protein
MDVEIGDTIEIYDTYVVKDSVIKVTHHVGVICAITNDVVGVKDSFGNTQVFDLDLESYRILNKKEETNGNN